MDFVYMRFILQDVNSMPESHFSRNLPQSSYRYGNCLCPAELITKGVCGKNSRLRNGFHKHGFKYIMQP